MPLGTSFLPDTQAVAVGGVIAEMTPAQEVTAFNVANAVTPVVSFNFQYGSEVVQFFAGKPAFITGDLLTKLLAANAPVSVGSLSQALNFVYPSNSTNIAALFGG
ncbi:MAG: hypothetical protein ACXWAT_00850 [Methylobacter sp.]